MRFNIHTLFDITETRARKGDDGYKVKQHQNYLSILNTIGLRVNPTYISEPTCEEKTLKGFGTDYKGKQRVWSYSFDVDYEGALDIATMINDFDVCPIITGLDETVEINPAVIRTQDKAKTNVIFELIDK
jgi:hypothetical protein